MAPVKSPADLLEQYRLKPKHSWGQNFLGDEGVLAQIADEASLRPGDACVELGAGLGHLTRHLLATGAKVTAVERDRELVAVLEAEKLEDLTLVAANAADVKFHELAKADQVIVVGNLPYHLSSPILFEVLEQADHVKRAVFTLLLEVCERLAAQPGTRDYGLLSVLLGLRYEPVHCFDIGRSHFTPPPNVDSAVLRLERRPKPRAEVKDELRFRRLVKASFGQRRKTLNNSIQSDKVLAKEYDLVGALQRAGIDGKRRAETLSVEEFAAIERALEP